MDWGDVPGPVVALLAMIVTIFQTRSARGSRVAAEQQAAEATNSRMVAEKQAAEAEKSRLAAEKQADAAIEQVKIMRQQLDADQNHRVRQESREHVHHAWLLVSAARELRDDAETEVRYLFERSVPPADGWASVSPIVSMHWKDVEDWDAALVPLTARPLPDLVLMEAIGAYDEATKALYAQIDRVADTIADRDLVSENDLQVLTDRYNILVPALKKLDAAWLVFYEAYGQNGDSPNGA